MKCSITPRSKSTPKQSSIDAATAACEARFVDVDDVPGIVSSVRAAFDAGASRSLEWRAKQLSQLALAVAELREDIVAAWTHDLGQPEMWGEIEITGIIDEAKAARAHLKQWTAAQSVSTPLLIKPGSAWRKPEPLGVALIIAPWNYPFSLSLNPLIGAIAAGNCAVLKPSEVAPTCSGVLRRIVEDYLDGDCIRCLEGAVPETTALLAQRWDHIFYTGNGFVGRIVMRAAAEHLTPVTLELGGKSPTIVDDTADLALAAKRIAWGKWSNCGQTCVTSDYVLVHDAKRDEFLRLLQDNVRQFYGDNPQDSDDYSRVVNARHVARIQGLMEGHEVFMGGDVDAEDNYISPTIIVDPPLDSKLMSEEIFGPVLPVLTMSSLDEAIAMINSRPKPLALYVFSSSKANQNKVLSSTSSGGAGINETVMQVGVHSMPFGGVGESGMGGYHGKASFDTFSHYKSVLNRGTWVDPSFRYPPYDDSKVTLLKRLRTGFFKKVFVRGAVIVALGAGALAYYMKTRIQP